jgi:hypothetical protein
MKLKLDASGAALLTEVNGVKMPVYVHDDGKEAPFDAAATVQAISARAEQSHRVEAENATLKTRLGTYSGIEDPVAALKAIDTMKNFDLKKLVDAGEVDKVKSEVAKVYETKVADLQKQVNDMTQSLYQERVGGAFTRSKMIAEKFAIPADLVQARFGQHFALDGGRIYATDAAGNKLYSRTRPGELADFDEGLMTLVEQYPYKDMILKGTGSSGGGAATGGTAGVSGGKRTVTRAQFDLMDAQERAKAAKEASIVD